MKTRPTEKADKPSVAETSEPTLNRETKRMMKKREGAADRLKRPAPNAKRKRTKPMIFIKEVRGELARVAWPTRPEVITYSTVVLITVVFFMLLISGIDFVALKGVLYLIGLGSK
ncbi:MAG: preprotein translocase subunit SecE [Actinomycetota bacterium]